MSTLVRVDGLVVTYVTEWATEGAVDGLKDATAVRALDGASLHIAAGERVGLVGASGSGKSTLGMALGRLLAANARYEQGRIQVDGQDVLSATPATLRQLRRERLGCIFQNPMSALDPTLRIGRQMALALGAKGGPSAGSAENIARWLSRVGLPDPARVAASFPHELSGGMAQRVAIAMALARRPALLIADEPTASLDAAAKGPLLDLLDGLLRETGAALLLISHDLRLVAQHCDRVLVMADGRVVESSRGDAVNTLTHHLDAPAAVRAAVDATRTVVELRQVGVTYRQGPPWRRRAVAALQGVNLRIEAGQTLGLVGASGSGKTTLGRVALGLLAPTQGAALFDGQPLNAQASPRLRRSGALAAVFQHPEWALNPRLRCSTSVAEPLHIQGRGSAAERAAAVAAMLEQVGLSPDLAQRYPGELSGGQRQRMAIARALITRPRFIVFDEAVSALDVAVRGQILTLIRRLQGEFGFAALFISHDLAATRAVSQRIAVLLDGQVVEDAPTR